MKPGTKTEMRKRKSKRSPEEIEAIRKRYEETDVTLRALGKECGIPNSSLSLMKKNGGWKKKGDEQKKANEEKARKLCVEGILTDKEIAFECGMDIDRLKYIKKRDKWKSNARKRTRLTKEQLQEMKKLCNEDILSTGEIAEYFGVSTASVWNHKKTDNWGERSKNRKKVPVEIREKVKKEYEETEIPVRELAGQYGVTVEWIRSIAYRLGWERESDRRKWEEKLRKQQEEEERLKELYKAIGAIKVQVTENIGKPVNIKTWNNGGRRSKKCTEFTGVIKGAFRNVFTVQKKSGLMTSFSYVDIFEKGCPGARTEVIFNR